MDSEINFCLPVRALLASKRAGNQPRNVKCDWDTFVKFARMTGECLETTANGAGILSGTLSSSTHGWTITWGRD